MHPKGISNLNLQAAACVLCYRSINLTTECWRANRVSGGVTHLTCLAVYLTAEEYTDRPPSEVADIINDCAEELSEAFCENSAHMMEG